MNKWEKEVQKSLLESEKEALEELEKHYKRALRDIDEKVKILLSDELTQSRAYRLEYQTALHNQISGILEKLHSDEYTTISQFLKDSYNNGFIGTMYDLHGQGVPMLFAVDPKSAVKAVLTDSKLSEPLYKALGIDINSMKKRVSAEITRGIAAGMSNYEIARNLHNASKAPLSRARTIARTESHRIQEAASFDAGKLAKSKGADIVKQWDASLDGDTRETHRALDGKIVELDEPFVSGGNKAMYPGDFGDPAEDCNCRCSVLKRARSALDEDELKTLQERAEFFELDKTEDFEEFKEKYLNIQRNSALQQTGGRAMPPAEYDGVFDDFEPLDLSKAEEESLYSLHSQTMKSGHEYAVVIENGKAGAPFTSQLPDTVQVSLGAYGGGLTVLHSHTNATPFSVADFRYLLDEKVDKIGVIGYNNDIFMAYIGSGEKPSMDELSDITDKIGYEAERDMMDDPGFFGWSLEERNYMFVREQMYRIARHFGWTVEGGRVNGT